METGEVPTETVQQETTKPARRAKDPDPSANGSGPQLEDFLADIEAEEAGVWRRLEPPMQAIEVCIRSSYCEDFRRRQSKLYQSAAEMLIGTDEDADHDLLSKRAAGERLLVGWRGMPQFQGQPFEWTKERALVVMTDRRFHYLRDAIYLQIAKLSKLQEKKREQLGKA